jgi:hypothetical protein
MLNVSAHPNVPDDRLTLAVPTKRFEQRVLNSGTKCSLARHPQAVAPKSRMHFPPAFCFVHIIGEISQKAVDNAWRQV